MKKILVLLLITMITLSGCGHEHTWKEATCDTAKTCSDCGEVEGKALGHDWVEANYQTAKTCNRCKVVEGEALQSDFEAKGLVINAVPDVTYDYYTCGRENPEIDVLGELTFYEYQVIASDETHEAKEGYEWRTVKVDLLFADENVLIYGAEWSSTWEDYYTIDKHDSSANVVDNEGTSYQFTVNYNGKDYEECMYIKNSTHSGWDGNTYLINYEFSFLVPVGYDGCVIGFYHGATEWGEGQHIYDIADENTVFFRLN